jgi:hypothetical protein
MHKLILPSLLFVLGFTSCEDPVEIEIDNGISQIAVDGFVNNLETPQIIYLKYSKEFFDGVDQIPVIDAIVKIVDSEGKVYNFIDTDDKGEYTWSDSILVHEGITYNLEISHGDELYTSEEKANPVPVIDSLKTGPIEGGFGGNVPTEGEFQVEMISQDIVGRDDYYWIKTFRNDTLDSAPGSINVSSDGGGSGSDGVLFIPPVRIFRINNFGRPYTTGEKVEVQIHSINMNTFLFFNQVSNQLNNSGLFAVPTSNVRTNIESSSAETSKIAIGMFSVSMVSKSVVNL